MDECSLDELVTEEEHSTENELATEEEHNTKEQEPERKKRKLNERKGRGRILIQLIYIDIPTSNLRK